MLQPPRFIRAVIRFSNQLGGWLPCETSAATFLTDSRAALWPACQPRRRRQHAGLPPAPGPVLSASVGRTKLHSSAVRFPTS